MTIDKIKELMVIERDRLNNAIAALGQDKAFNEVRRHRTPEQKAAQSAKMIAYWEGRKASAKKKKKA